MPVRPKVLTVVVSCAAPCSGQFVAVSGVRAHPRQRGVKGL